jgi:hypothetical protein
LILEAASGKENNDLTHLFSRFPKSSYSVTVADILFEQYDVIKQGSSQAMHGCLVSTSELLQMAGQQVEMKPGLAGTERIWL